MRDDIPILCDDPAIAVECALLARDIGLAAAPAVAGDAVGATVAVLERGGLAGLALGRAATPNELVALATACFASGARCALVTFADGPDGEERAALASDLGLVVLSELRPMLAALALLRAETPQPWNASTRGLGTIERVRLGLRSAGPGTGRLVRLDDGRIGWAHASGNVETIALGEARDAAEALRALRDAAGASPPGRTVVEGVDERAVDEVLFGPPRALSDPASKAALEPYGLPLPLEELCSSPSRAAAEAAQMGFPVRIALASPDLRIWDHPDLAVDGVDSAARVRDVFRQLTTMASERRPDARLLGVTVSATTHSAALLCVRAEPIDGGWVLAEIGFADPHGLAARDRTRTVLPASPDRLERALQRLRGSSLFLDGTPTRRRATVNAIADALLRLSAFVDRHRREVVSVEIRPLAVLVGGGVEAREVCVTVGDYYLRSLEAPARESTG